MLVVFSSACATTTGPTLVEVSAWVGEGAEQERRIDRLAVPRNALLSMRLVSLDARAPSDRPPVVVVRGRTEDGGTVTWAFGASQGDSEPLRVKGLTGLEVVAGLEGRAQSGGPFAVALGPPLGALGEGAWASLAGSVADRGGALWIAASLPVELEQPGAPGVEVRRLEVRGASREGEGAVVVALELDVQIIDRDYRPKERHKRKHEYDDPVKKPRPRSLASLR